MQRWARITKGDRANFPGSHAVRFLAPVPLVFNGSALRRRGDAWVPNHLSCSDAPVNAGKQRSMLTHGDCKTTKLARSSLYDKSRLHGPPVANRYLWVVGAIKVNTGIALKITMGGKNRWNVRCRSGLAAMQTSDAYARSVFIFHAGYLFIAVFRCILFGALPTRERETIFRHGGRWNNIEHLGSSCDFCCECSSINIPTERMSIELSIDIELSSIVLGSKRCWIVRTLYPSRLKLIIGNHRLKYSMLRVPGELEFRIYLHAILNSQMEPSTPVTKMEEEAESGEWKRVRRRVSSRRTNHQEMKCELCQEKAYLAVWGRLRELAPSRVMTRRIFGAGAAYNTHVFRLNLHGAVCR